MNERIINLTPHAITVFRADGSQLVFPTEGKARVVEQTTPAMMISGIPLVDKKYVAAEGLPPACPGTFHIVSYYTRAAEPEREDLLVPHDLVRDAGGNIIGCRAFSIRENVTLA